MGLVKKLVSGQGVIYSYAIYLFVNKFSTHILFVISPISSLSVIERYIYIYMNKVIYIVYNKYIN